MTKHEDKGGVPMRRIFAASLGAVLMVAAYAPGAAAEEVCNYGRMASNAATSSGSFMRDFTQSSGPLTITTGAGASSEVNVPRGQEMPLGCSTE